MLPPLLFGTPATPPPYPPPFPGSEIPGAQHNSDFSDAFPHHTSNQINWAEGTNQLWDLFFTNYYAVSEKSYANDPNFYHNVFGNYFLEWFNTLSSNDQTTYQKGSSQWTSQEQLQFISSFTSFLENSDIRLRNLSPFLWIYGLISGLLTQIQQSTVEENNRTVVITNAQQTANNVISSLNFPTGSNAQAQAQQEQVQAVMQVYIGYTQVANNRLQASQNAASNTNQGISAESNLISGIMQQMQEMLSGIFK